MQSVRELVDGECGQARRGQFERQRDAVEPAADLRNCTRIARIERESGHDGLRPVDEKPRRFASRDVLGAWRIVLRQRQ